MNEPLLAQRKQLLQARSALYRLRISRELRVLSSWPQAGAFALTLPIRPLLVSLALAIVPKTRLAAWAAAGTRAMLLARLAGAALRWVRREPGSVRKRTDLPDGQG